MKRTFVLLVGLLGSSLGASAQQPAPGATTPPAAAPTPPANFGCPGPEYKQFNFMLGEWFASPTAAAQPAKVPSVWKSMANGCIVLESWQTGTPREGHSINYYDQADKRWHQHWVDSTGDAVHYVGEWKEGKMVFTADDTSTPDPKPVKLTMTFEPKPDGTVRQSGTMSTDGGKTFAPSFDLTYRPRASVKP